MSSLTAVSDCYWEEEPPDNRCMFPSLRMETDRLLSFSRLAQSTLPNGVFITSLAMKFYFCTQEGWIICYGCGIHYGIGHAAWCRAPDFNVPFRNSLDEWQKRANLFDAVTISIAKGLLVLKSNGAISPQRTGLQPSTGPMDLDMSDTRPVAPRRVPPTVAEAHGFTLEGKASVKCQRCGQTIRLDKLTPFHNSHASFPHILKLHTIISPRCVSPE